MSSKVELLNHEPLSHKAALNKSFNVVQRHEQLHAKNAFTAELWRQRDSIAAVVRHHLRLRSSDAVTVYGQDEWLAGGFNMCVPIDVEVGATKKKLLMKCPMPFKVAEARHPGSVDEKLRSEAGAYAWMQQNCPGIRVPHLYGFGSPGYQFTHTSALPWYHRLWHAFRGWISSTLLKTGLSRYSAHGTLEVPPSHYLLLEFIGPEVGQILVKSWADKINDVPCRKRLFHGMADIIIQMARVPQPRIGSFRFNDDCTVGLDNRAMFAATAILESQGAPLAAKVGQTYSSTEQFVADMMSFYDHNFASDVCASEDEPDCRGQMATWVFLRAVAHHFINKEYRDGPFLPQLTDLNPGNFFVDDEWNITCLFDLEWVCALPVECLDAPYWLTGCDIGSLTNDELVTYTRIRQEFITVLRQEEAKHTLAWPLCAIMEDMWARNGTWFWYSLASVNGAFWLVLDHLAPSFSLKMTVEADNVLSHLWAQRSDKVVETKLAEFGQYADDVGKLFK